MKLHTIPLIYLPETYHKILIQTWNTTFGGTQPSVDYNLWWKTTFGGRWPSDDPCMLLSPLCGIFSPKWRKFWVQIAFQIISSSTFLNHFHTPSKHLQDTHFTHVSKLVDWIFCRILRSKIIMNGWKISSNILLGLRIDHIMCVTSAKNLITRLRSSM